MADWKTYAKAARNTARRQAPEAREAARRASDRAGGYARAAGKALDGGLRGEGSRREHAGGREPGRRETGSAPRSRPLDAERLAKDAAAYYTVASRRAARANPIPRLLRALRDALLIGISLVAIWAVLAAAGLPIPFTTVLIVVGVIVAVSFGVGVYAQWKRAQDALDAAEDPRAR